MFLNDAFGSNDVAGLLGMALLNAGNGGEGGGLLNSLMMMKMMGMGGQQQNPMNLGASNIPSMFSKPEQEDTPNAIAQSASKIPGMLGNSPLQKQMPPQDEVARIANAIGQFESGGRYDALGPLTKGDRAYGRYQVMGNNIPSWSRDALGYAITPEQFLSNPQLQDQIAQHRMAQYYNKYGNVNDVASMWFSGRPMRGNNSRDVLGTSVPTYAKQVARYYYGS